MQSLKAALVSAIGGSILFTPISVAAAFLGGGGLSAQWEFDTDMLAFSMALFGITYVNMGYLIFLYSIVAMFHYY